MHIFISVCLVYCLQLLVLEVDTNKLFSIPLLSNSQTTNNLSSCGIHDIGISPTDHYVATSGQNPNDLALYKYPTFDPLLIGQVSCCIYYS